MKPLKVSRAYFNLTFSAGPVLKLLIADMNKKVKDNEFKKIFQFYSGHDTTITALMNTLGIFNGLQPPFSSALIIELRRKDDQHIVTVSSRDTVILA